MKPEAKNSRYSSAIMQEIRQKIQLYKSFEVSSLAPLSPMSPRRPARSFLRDSKGRNLSKAYSSH